MRFVLPFVLLAACSEYDLGSGGLESYQPDPRGPGASSDDDLDGTGDDGDTGGGDDTGPDACWEPEDGYETNPAARLIVNGAGPITVSYLGFDSSYTDELWLDAPFSLLLAVAGETATGAVVGTTTQPEGTELVFGIQVRNTGDHFQSGPGTRNADNTVHVAMTYEGDCSWVIGFEDLFGGGDLDFNDTQLRIQGPLRQD